MATRDWESIQGGDWGTAANWWDRQVPGAADNVIINHGERYYANFHYYLLLGWELGEVTHNLPVFDAIETLFVGKHDGLQINAGGIDINSSANFEGRMGISGGMLRIGNDAVVSSAYGGDYLESWKLDLGGVLSNFGIFNVDVGTIWTTANKSEIKNGIGATFDIKRDNFIIEEKQDIYSVGGEFLNE